MANESSAYNQVCPECGKIMTPVWFEEEEFNKHNIPTGCVRDAVDYLICEFCGCKECVDDSFDGPWHQK